jgi:hypothetical protein
LWSIVVVFGIVAVVILSSFDLLFYLQVRRAPVDDDALQDWGQPSGPVGP